MFYFSSRTNIIHMTTSVSRRLNILYIKFKIIVFFIITLLTMLYVRVGILLTSRKHLYDPIISLRWKVWVHKTSLTPLRFIAVQSQESDQSCICVLVGADPGFQVRGGGEGRLKKIVRSGGRHKHFWGISCEKSRFYAKKIIFFPILGGCPPPPGSTPG